MCGIVAIYGDGAERWLPQLEGMMGRLHHRGPDDQGVYTGRDIVLGQKRLSIIDVTGGRQPIFNEDGTACIVCNGEVYNHLALKEGLGRHRFSTRSDTEAILHLFEEEGAAAVSRLDGMFAFVLYDGRDIVVARDPLGIKPLYQGRRDGCLFFASEIKALAGVAEAICEFPAGHLFSSREGLARYYQVPAADGYQADVADIVAAVREKLSRAVQKRLMSDVPLGVFLSGGLDSSVIAAVARRHFDRLSSFSVGMEGSADLSYAQKVARFLGTDHHQYVYTRDELVEVLPQVIYHLESYDPPLVRSAIPTYFVSRLAAEQVKVILTGEGSDEVFAGYHYFKDVDGEEALQRESMRILNGLHNVNLQRVDRATMAHSIEGRVPFLDIDFVEYATAIDPGLKLCDEGRMEKWLLREAFTGYLPDEVLWRTKAEFADGCGSAHLVAELAEEEISDAEFQRQRGARAGAPLASKEELYYFRLFQGFFGTEVLDDAIGRWRGHC